MPERPVRESDMAGLKPKLRALLVNDASLSGHHGSALVTSQLCHLAQDAGLDVVPGWTWDAATKGLASEDIPFELVIVNGEGSLHDNSRSSKRIAAMAAELARTRRLPAYLVNATIEGNSPEIDRDLGQFRLRFVRDTQSQAELTRVQVTSDVVHDLTLTAAWLPRVEGRGALLVTDASDQAKTKRLLARALAWPDAQAITLRARPPWPQRGDPTRRLGFELKRQTARFVPLSPWSLRYGCALDRDRFIARLAHDARGIVCGRYHAVCIALRMGVPFIAIEGNTGKTGALLADVGFAHRGVSLAGLEAAEAPPVIAPFSDVERRQIDRFLATTENAAGDMFRRIADDARRWHGAVNDAVA